MTITIEQFAAQCKAALTAEPGTKGRELVLRLVKQVLAEPGFVATCIPEGTPERRVLYEDPDLGFTILAHGYTGAKGSNKHKHRTTMARPGRSMARPLAKRS